MGQLDRDVGVDSGFINTTKNLKILFDFGLGLSGIGNRLVKVIERR